MAIVTLSEMKAHLSFTEDMGTADDAIIMAKVEAAQGYVERFIGYALSEATPPILREAIMQIAAHWYENREAVNVGNIVNEVPLSASDILKQYRGWTF